MSEKIGGSGAVELRVQVHAHPDRPGIARITVGDQVLFDGEGASVLEAEVRTTIPFHTAFQDPRLALVWKEGPAR